MYMVVRQYSAAGELGDQMEQRSNEVQDLLSAVPGFIAYYAARDGDHLTSITICADQTGTEESNRRAAAWVKENLPGTSIGAPSIGQGEVFIDFTS